MGHAFMVALGLLCAVSLGLMLALKRVKFWKTSCKDAEETIKSLQEDIKLKEKFDEIRKNNESAGKDASARLSAHDDSVLSELRDKSKNREKVTDK